MHKAAFGKHMSHWGHLATTVNAHADELEHLQPAAEVLTDAMAAAQEARRRQLEHRAAAQQATRDLEAALEKAHEAATRLHTGVWNVYGHHSEKLHEFGMRPYPRSRRNKPVENPTEE